MHSLVEGIIGPDLHVDSFYDVGLSDWRTAAQAVICFFALARFDCITKLLPEHISFMDSLPVITFPKSKTNQLGEGMSVSIHRSESGFCPVDFLER